MRNNNLSLKNDPHFLYLIHQYTLSLSLVQWHAMRCIITCNTGARTCTSRGLHAGYSRIWRDADVAASDHQLQHCGTWESLPSKFVKCLKLRCVPAKQMHLTGFPDHKSECRGCVALLWGRTNEDITRQGRRRSVAFNRRGLERREKALFREKSLKLMGKRLFTCVVLCGFEGGLGKIKRWSQSSHFYCRIHAVWLRRSGSNVGQVPFVAVERRWEAIVLGKIASFKYTFMAVPSAIWMDVKCG